MNNWQDTNRDGQLKVTRGPIFRKLKSSGPKNRKKEKRSYKISIYFYCINSPLPNDFLDFTLSLKIIYEANKLDCCEVTVFIITFCCNLSFLLRSIKDKTNLKKCCELILMYI